MRYLRFRAPNFRFKVVDPTGAENYWLDHAESEEALRRKHEDSPFRIVEVQPYDFDEWRKRAAAETERVLDAKATGKLNGAFKFKEDLWRELKQYLFLLAGERCGYCEVHVPASSPGAVEHYRPKRKVEEDPSHEGYYWLAYDPDNYVPSCTNCNSGKGKMNQFPIAGARALAHSDDINGEQPLLFNPFTMNPADHFEFHSNGLVTGTSSVGDESARVYRLNRGHLVARRREAVRQALTHIKFWVTDKEFRKRTLPELFSRSEFPSALMDEAFRRINEMIQQREEFIQQEQRELEELRNARSRPAPPSQQK